MAPIALSTPFAVSAKSQPAPSRLEERGSPVNVTSTYSHFEKDNTGNFVDEERRPKDNAPVGEACIIA